MRYTARDMLGYHPFTLDPDKEGKLLRVCDVLEAIGEITFVRGITEECNIHNAKNRERERIKKELGLEE